MTINLALEQLNDAATLIGGWCHLADSLSAEIVANLDVDYVVVDLQHGAASQSNLMPMLQAITAASKTPMVRIPYRDLGTAQRALDAGAEGLIIPMVNTLEDANDVVASVRYPPLGSRSYGPLRSQMLLGRDPEEVNRQVICLVQIETAEAMKNIDDILEVEGIDGVYVGPADLSLSHGFQLGENTEQLNEMLLKVSNSCERADRIPGIHCFSGESALEAQAMGYRLTSVGSDAVWLREEYSNQLMVVREKGRASGGGYY